ncbi:hypothetical protein TNIN_407151, partial [Trichonephila inaurata madagascariensis]
HEVTGCRGETLHRGRGTAKEEEQRSRKTIEQERLPSSSNLNHHQEERCKPKGDQSGPEENDVRGPARTTRVDTTAAVQRQGSPKAGEGAQERTIQSSSQRQSRNSRQQDRQETNGTPANRRIAPLEVLIGDVKDRKKNFFFSQAV